MRMEIFSKEIPVFKSVFCGDIDRETEKELSLPDYCPDITRVIRVDATPYIENCNASGSKCTVSGTYIFTVLYESDYNSALAYATFPVSFSESVDIKNAGTENRVGAKMNIRRIGCKMINPRKFALRAKSALALTVKSVERKSVTDVNTLPENVYVKKDVLKWQEQGEPKVYEFQFRESYSLPERATPIDDVVMNSFSVEKPEYTVSDNGITLKTTVTGKLLYSGEGGGEDYIMSTKQFPVTMLLDDISAESDACVDADAMVSKAEISVDVDSYGENRVVEAAFTVKVTVTPKRNVTAEYATDAFASEVCGTAVISQFNTLAEGEKINRVFSAESRFTPEAVRFTEICDYSANISECKIRADENGTVLYGTYTVSLLGKTENGYASYDQAVAFEEKLTADKICFDACEIECNVFEANVLTASDGSINVRVMCRATVFTENTVTVNAVTDIKTNCDKRNSATLIFCYPTANDDLWSIAKRYFANPECIASDNPEAFDSNGNVLSRNPIRISK